MGGSRNGWKRSTVGAAMALAAWIAAPAVDAGTGGVVATPVGSSGSTVYMSVTSLSLQPTTTTLNLSAMSGLTTVVGSTTVVLAPLATATVPVPMSGSISKLSVSVSLSVSIVDTDGPFCK